VASLVGLDDAIGDELSVGVHALMVNATSTATPKRT
jgi:hypothetical protein